VCGRYQDSVAADVHGSAPTRCLLSPGDCITGVKRDGKANSASAFRSVEGAQALPCLFHGSRTSANVVPQKGTAKTE